MGFKLLAGIDSAGQLAPHLFAGLDLAHDLVGPFMGHMTVRAGGAHAGTVGVVDGLAVLLIDIGLHLMATDAELFGIGQLHPPVKATPEDDAAAKAKGQHQPHGHLAGAGQRLPEASNKGRNR